MAMQVAKAFECEANTGPAREPPAVAGAATEEEEEEVRLLAPSASCIACLRMLVRMI